MNFPREYSVTTSNADQTRALGAAIGQILAAGDLVMLKGELGAGKTTLTQGIGEGMGVRGRVASPTFIVARVHPSQCGGPDLIHADAYRITDLDDLETLDLDSGLDEAAVVVEWGEGKAESLSENRLEIEVRRATGGTADTEGTAIDLEAMDDGRRTIVLRPCGSRWDGVLDNALRTAEEAMAAQTNETDDE
ncbi:tRNA (adenosine(37)-N6)-threonylcarbamoyltransferase complex ATPase subunit type 1 TsaE [Schaalia vaccimaxillae]|uniref:tRNA (adenosine(37)-N6)-threonylcarbamoyltransferase complex ATPase subunit type 1 TsaE n=1 Tax=Schaalia vaccimaxillae TaxID=183916 RepID=UPI0003B3B961|nr:tRNA (adenosine(37)-N6)-threonylcarbamoyltransferase complex ATPase subunit type 1 TsaE [Schaalia vaccimaxillae]